MQFNYINATLWGCEGGTWTLVNNPGTGNYAPSGINTNRAPLLALGGTSYGYSSILYLASLTSGGVVYGSSATQLSSSAALANGQFVLGGGAGSPPTTSFSVVPGANGGTGVANTGFTLTLAGNVAFTGAFNPTFSIPATGTWTFPAAGTLVNTSVTTLSLLTSIGTIGTGTWQGTIVGSAYGGTGVNNSATLTLGSSNQNWATLGTGPVCNTTTTGALSNISLTTTGSSGAATLSGCTLNIPQYTGGGGSGTVNSGTSGHIGYYATSGTAISSDSNLDDGATTANTLTYVGSGGLAAPGFTGTGSAASIVAFPANATPGTVPANSYGFTANAAMTTSYLEYSPNAVPTANQVKLYGAPTSNIGTWTWTSISGSGNFAMTTSPVLTTPKVLGSSTGGDTITSALSGSTSYTITIPTHSANDNFCLQTAANCGSGGLTVGTTAISGGTNTRIEYNNSGVLGEYAISGTGSVAMTTSPSFTTPSLGVATATSLNVSSGPACTAGTAGGFCGAEGTDITNVAGAGALDFNATTHEITYQSNGSALKGMLVRAQPGSINQTAQTGAISTATLCASSAGACNTAGQYAVDFDFWGSGTACSNVTAGSVTFLLTWTDENAVAHSAVAQQMMAQTGAATTAMQASFPFQTTLANEGAGGHAVISTNGSIIQYGTGYVSCTTGTGTYGLRATVTRIQ